MLRYTVITPARDEADNIPRLAESLLAQSVLPERWLVVDNGSHDRTREIVEAQHAASPWIQLLVTEGENSAVRGRPIVRALHRAFEELPDPPDIVVNVDADISFDADFFERLLAAFERDPALGIASGTCYELEADGWRERHVTGSTVWGATRAYRWECLRQVLPLEERLGWDGIDEFKANALGWSTETLKHLPFRHHRKEGERDGGQFRARAAQGRSAWYMGYRPWYLVLRALHNARRDRAALGLVWGYAAAALSRDARMSDPAARAYLRRQQSLRHLPARLRESRGRQDR
ncbi:MAG: dolichol-phosphate mannosyltransferase [Gaiellaceae bacterium]|jgi:glycosyltransferase involved in cell wall biosynthesis|nr:dolichol-phosphate mannosyltransferase [Gaiellaceae bacterium]